MFGQDLPQFESRRDLLVVMFLTSWPFLLGMVISAGMAVGASIRELPAVLGLFLSLPLVSYWERRLPEWARQHPGRPYRRG